MKGLELSRKYYLECGRTLLEERTPELIPYIAVGLCGSGSECYGLDDDISQDHDFEPGFCIFIPDETVLDRKASFELERAYSYLPKEFLGYRRSPLSPAGGNRHGVIRISDFFVSKTGYPGLIPTEMDWLGIPDSYLAEAVNGEIFHDNYGLVTEIRSHLSKMPLNILKKKMAGNMVLMSQAGSYNYSRCVMRGDSGAAGLCIYEFVRHAMACIYLINGSYMPYYKLAFKGLQKLPILADTYDFLISLISPLSAVSVPQDKAQLISSVTSSILSELYSLGLIKTVSDMGKAAYELNDSINDINIRNMDILAGVE